MSDDDKENVELLTISNLIYFNHLLKNTLYENAQTSGN